MSKAKMQAAKELIQSKQYTEARAILKTVDDPKARQWEAQLNKISKPVQRTRPTIWIFALNIIAFIGGLAAMLMLIIVILTAVNKTSYGDTSNDHTYAFIIIVGFGTALVCRFAATQLANKYDW